jgi:fumarylpyruvate hydrolase
MIWRIPEIISELSRYYWLQAGDLIYSGTPAGVGALQRGDSVAAGIDGVGELRHSIG